MHKQPGARRTTRRLPAPAAAAGAALLAAAFHTAAWAQSLPALRWSADTVINQACAKCDNDVSQLAVDGRSGRAVAVWPQRDAVPDIAAARYDPAIGTWRGFTDIYHGVYKDPNSVMSAQVKMDGAGNAFAVWAEPGSNSIFGAHYDAASAKWGAPFVLHAGSDFFYPVVKLAVDARGDAVVAWSGQATDAPIVARHYDAAKRTWSATMPVSGSKPVDRFSNLGIDAAGNAMVLWTSSDNTANYSRYDAAAGHWSGPALAGPANAKYGADFVLDPAGNGTALWFTGSDTQHRAFLTVARFDGRTHRWGAPEVVQTAPGYVYYPSLAADRFGNAFVVWGQSSDFSVAFRGYAVRYNAARGHWSTAVKFTRDDSHDALFFKVATDRCGNAVAVWSKRISSPATDPRVFRKAASRYDMKTGSWGPVTFGRKQAVEGAPTDVAIDDQGVTTVLYRQDSGYRWHGSIIFNTRASRLTPQ